MISYTLAGTSGRVACYEDEPPAITLNVGANEIICDANHHTPGRNVTHAE